MASTSGINNKEVLDFFTSVKDKCSSGEQTPADLQKISGFVNQILDRLRAKRDAITASPDAKQPLAPLESQIQELTSLLERLQKVMQRSAK